LRGREAIDPRLLREGRGAEEESEKRASDRGIPKPIKIQKIPTISPRLGTARGA
jgi:hypothetical protein